MLHEAPLHSSTSVWRPAVPTAQHSSDATQVTLVKKFPSLAPVSGDATIFQAPLCHSSVRVCDIPPIEELPTAQHNVGETQVTLSSESPWPTPVLGHATIVHAPDCHSSISVCR